MVDQYTKFMAELDNPKLPHPKRQSIEAGLVMLEEFMALKTRDIKRQLRSNE